MIKPHRVFFVIIVRISRLKAYRLYDIEATQMIISEDMIFMEDLNYPPPSSEKKKRNIKGDGIATIHTLL